MVKRERPRFKDFTKKEVLNIVITALILGFLYSWNYDANNWNEVIISFLQVTFFVLISVLVHQFGHKFASQLKGLKTEYKLQPLAIMVAVYMTLLSKGKMIFYALGSIEFDLKHKSGFNRKIAMPHTDEMGLISLAGPWANLAFALLLKIFGPLILKNDSWIYLSDINAWMSVYHLIPIPNLDGVKALYYNKVVWLITFITSLITLLLLPYAQLKTTLYFIILIIVVTVIYAMKFEKDLGIKV